MKFTKTVFLLSFILALCLFPVQDVFAGSSIDTPETDTTNRKMFGFFDLRDRETFIQITNVFSQNHNIHIQLFDVSNNCNENNFFDLYTPADTHIYNLRDIVTNDGNDSGVVLPEGAYGVFVAFGAFSDSLIGNVRIVDNNGFEYRSNIQGTDMDGDTDFLEEFATFNFNTASGVTLSDIVIIPVEDDDSDKQEALLADILNVWYALDVNIYDLNEVVFSCRQIISSCINSEGSLYEALLEEVADDCGDCAASVADIEWGINNAIPHSKGGELLCPGNIISDGIVRLERLGRGDEAEDELVVYIGLNNGNGRGSMDAFFTQNAEIPTSPPG